MDYTFDYFVAETKCFNCRRISPGDESTNMQTYIRDIPNLENLGVGSLIGQHLNEADGYLKISKPGEKTILLDTWNCTYCGYRNWARIVLLSGVIESIDSVELKIDEYRTSNYISQDVSNDAAYLSGYDYETVKRMGVLEVLTQYLEKFNFNILGVMGFRELFLRCVPCNADCLFRQIGIATLDDGEVDSALWTCIESPWHPRLE
jgi:hypothetical protein